MDGELLFFIGYPGTTAPRVAAPASIHVRHSWFRYMDEIKAVPFILQQTVTDIPIDMFDPTCHVLICYPERGLRTAGGPATPLPNPKGMSGSLLWDTKLVACGQAGRSWSPYEARICGLVCLDVSELAMIMVIRIESLMPLLLSWSNEPVGLRYWLGKVKALMNHLDQRFTMHEHT